MIKNSNSIVNQEIKGKLVKKEVVTCMSSYVDYILLTTYESYENYKNAPFNYDDIENIYIDNSEQIMKLKEKIKELEEVEELAEEQEEKIEELKEKITELEEEQDEQKEVFEWWEVSSWFIRKLKDKGEVVIPHMNLWGRQTTGQAILLDNVISEIANDMEILEGQANDWSK